MAVNQNTEFFYFYYLGSTFLLAYIASFNKHDRVYLVSGLNVILELGWCCLMYPRLLLYWLPLIGTSLISTLLMWAYFKDNN